MGGGFVETLRYPPQHREASLNRFCRIATITSTLVACGSPLQPLEGEGLDVLGARGTGPEANETTTDSTLGAPHQPLCVDPISIDSRTLVVDARGLHLVTYTSGQPVLQTLAGSSDEERLGQPVRLSDGVGPARVLLPVSDGETCGVMGIGADLEPLFTKGIGTGACVGLAADGEVALLVIARGDVGEASLVDAGTGAVIDALPLDAPPSGAVASLTAGSVMNGGSHWLVGVGDAILRLRGETSPSGGTSLSVTATLGLVGTPSHILTLPDGVAAATLRMGPLDASVLGDAVQPLLAPADGSLSTIGALVVPDGGITARPVAAPCDELVANGGSHWWCPDTVLVVGGLARIDAYSLPAGTLLRTMGALEERVTGLRLGDDGVIHNGGSHWLSDPAGWSVRAHAADGAGTLLIDGDGAACVPSPLRTASGALLAIATGTDVTHLALSESTVAVEAAGWPRGSGGTSGASTAVATGAFCSGSERAVATIEPLPDVSARLHGIASLPDGGAVAVGARSEQGDGVVVRLAMDGAVEWSQLVTGPGEAALFAVTSFGDNFVAVGRVGGPGGSDGLIALMPDADLLPETRTVGGDGAESFSDITKMAASGLALTGIRVEDGEAANDLWILGLEEDLTPRFERTFGLDGNDSGRGVEAFEDLVVVVGRAEAGPNLPGDGYIVGISTDGDDRFAVTIGGEFDDAFEDVAVSSALGVMAVGTRGLAKGDATWLVRLALDGTKLDERLLPGAGGAALAARPSGADILGADLLLTRVDAFGNVLQSRLLGAGSTSSKMDGLAIDTSPDQTLRATGIRYEDAGGTTSAIVIFTDAFGASSCEEANACLTVSATACDDGAPCTIDGCATDTGGCTHVPLADGSPCPGGSCQAGECVP